MNKMYKVCADIGDDIINFFTKSKWNAMLIAILCFVSPELSNVDYDTMFSL